jgi:hypothetical protein
MVHVPPGAASVYKVNVPTHIDEGPLMAAAAGTGITVSTAVATALPQLEVTV